MKKYLSVKWKKFTVHSVVDKAGEFVEFAKKGLIAALKGFKKYAKRCY